MVEFLATVMDKKQVINGLIYFAGLFIEGAAMGFWTFYLVQYIRLANQLIKKGIQLPQGQKFNIKVSKDQDPPPIGAEIQ